MKWVLARGHERALATFLATRPLIALDFDGTLAPIVRDPGRARVPAPTRSALKQLTALHTVVVLSGRARSDVAARVTALGVHDVVGNHGAELARDPAALRRTVARWVRLLGPALRAVPGVRLEDKGLSLSLHTRAAADPRAARAAVRTALAQLQLREQVRVIAGKAVTNLVPTGAPNKLDALERLMRRYRRGTALFVGDDVTDEDVFARADDSLWGVRVGRSVRSAAPWFVRDPREVAALLVRLAALGNTGGDDARARTRRRRSVPG